MGEDELRERSFNFLFSSCAAVLIWVWRLSAPPGVAVPILCAFFGSLSWGAYVVLFPLARVRPSRRKHARRAHVLVRLRVRGSRYRHTNPQARAFMYNLQFCVRATVRLRSTLVSLCGRGVRRACDRASGRTSGRSVGRLVRSLVGLPPERVAFVGRNARACFAGMIARAAHCVRGGAPRRVRIARSGSFARTLQARRACPLRPACC